MLPASKLILLEADLTTNWNDYDERTDYYFLHSNFFLKYCSF